MATYESKKYASIPIAATQVADGSVTDAEFQFINTLASNAQTQITARAPLAGATFTGAVRINDSQNFHIGSGTDLVISHDTNNSKINNTTGELRIGADTIKLMNQAEDETHLSATANGAVSVMHNNVTKIATSATGVTVTGTLAATAVTGDGSGLTSVSVAAAYPVGSIYINATNAANPNKLLGFGTWVRFGQGRMMISEDGTNERWNSAEETGGSETVTLTASQMPSHTHTKAGWSMSQGIRHQDGTDYIPQRGDQGGASGFFTTDPTGGGNAHDNMPPYIAVYMWKRTA